MVQIIWWWKIKEEYDSEIGSQSDIFGGALGEQRQKDLKTRVTQHNLVVASKYYHQLSISRLAVLLDLPADEVSCC